MKNTCLLLCLITSFIVTGQTNCDEANSYLVNAYSHVKDAYEANNISHLKYYANRSLESLKLSKKTLSSCGCEEALKLTDEGVELLIKVESAETYEDGRFYVKRAKDISKNGVIEVDKCSVPISEDEDLTQGNELSDLQNEQLKLKQQQETLKLKEKEIKAKLAEQKEKELKLKKSQLILSYKKVVSANINTYKESLKVCGCSYDTLTNGDSLSNSEQGIEAIKMYYKKYLKALASNYLSQLNTCNF